MLHAVQTVSELRCSLLLSLFAGLLVLEEPLVLRELLGKHELLRLVKRALARGGVEVVRGLVLCSAFHGLCERL